MTWRLQIVDWLLMGVAASALAAVVWTGTRWWGSSVRASNADAELARARAIVAAVERARALPPVLAEAPPAGDQLAAVRDTLGRAGLPESALRRVQAEADGASERMEGVTLPIRRSAMRVELDGLTLPELGRFFGVWRTQNPGWTPVLVNLSPRPETVRDGVSPAPGSAQSSSQSPPHWTVSMSMAALYLAPTALGSRADAGGRQSMSPRGNSRLATGITEERQKKADHLMLAVTSGDQSTVGKALRETRQ